MFIVCPLRYVYRILKNSTALSTFQNTFCTWIFELEANLEANKLIENLNLHFYVKMLS